MKFFLFSVILACTLSACAGSKSAANKDATPPPGYNPLYITGTAPYSKNIKKDPEFEISRVEASGPSTVKLYAHLVDSNGNYLRGAPKIKNVWCRIIDACNGKSDEIKDFKVKEVTEDMKTPIAIALVMDHSGSMGEQRAYAVQDAAEKFISLLRPEDGLALIKYDTKVVVESPLTGDQTILHSNMLKTGLAGFGGFTAIADAIAAGINIIAGAPGYSQRAIIVFTNGHDDRSKLEKDSIIRLAKRTNTIVCAVDFGENVDKDYMTSIADGTGGTHHQVYRTSEFDLVFGDIYRKLKNYYLVEYTPHDYGAHTVSVKLCLPHDSTFAMWAFDNSPKIGDVALLNVTFGVNKSDMLGESIPAIENAAYMMKANPGMKIELRVHTDNTNNTKDPDHNKKLSQRRADALKAELVKRGIAAERITAMGFGGTIPVADNSSEDGRRRNRRTEFVTVAR